MTTPSTWTDARSSADVREDDEMCAAMSAAYAPHKADGYSAAGAVGALPKPSVTWKPRETAMLLLSFVQPWFFSPRLQQCLEGKVRMGHGLVAPLTWYAPLMGNSKGGL